MRYVCPAILVALAVAVAPTSMRAQGLSITNYQLISQQSLSASQWYLTYSAELVNSGPALASVTATLTSNNPFSVRALQGTSTLNFTSIPANGQVLSSNTFTVLASSSTLNTSQIQWTFQTAAATLAANAGPNQTVGVGSTVTLNGSGSTTPTGVLSYSWKFSSRPAGSSTILNNWTSVMPSFVVDVAGTYAVTLTISNGAQSSSANVTISTTSTPPVANAGPNQTVPVGATALLNGSSSSDVDGNPLSFSWTMTNRPSGSAATLLGATTIGPSFVVDKAGSYSTQLIVKDGNTSSAPASITVTTQNSPPVANAGTGQVVTVGTTVQLDGSGSSDTDGNALTYQWSLITVPNGSAAALNNAAAVKPTFTADLAGTYVAQLIVNDGIENSTPATVTITTIVVLPPTANAGSNQTVTAGTVVSLSGSGTDPQSLQLTFHWSLTTRPANSSASLSSSTIANPTFSADLPGTYIAQLIVSNGTLSSGPSTVTITASAPSGLQLPANTIVAPGQTLALNVTLGSPAPANGLYVSLSSSNTSLATVTPLFVIPGGATAPITTPKLNGIAFGSATITATASGFPPATAAVQVTDTLTFSPASLTISGVTKGQLFVFIPEGAPAGGLMLNVSSSNPAVATVPATIVIAAGSSSANIPVTGVSLGSTVISASGANVTSATASVTIVAAVLSGPPTIAAVSGTNQSTPVNTAFAAPLVVIVRDSSSNPISGATVTFSAQTTTASGTFAGGVNTAVTNASGTATSAVFLANGTLGTYYVAATVAGAATPAGFILLNLPAAAGSTVTPPAGSSKPAFVTHATAASAGNGAQATTAAIDTTGCTPNCVIHICYAGSPAGLPAMPVGDDQGNTYRLANSAQEGDDVVVQDWYASGPNLSPTHHFHSTGFGNTLAMMAFKGVASGPDQMNQRGGYGFSPYTSGAITPTNPNEVVVSCWASYSTGMPYSVSPLAAVDTIGYNGGYNGNEALGSGYQIQTAAAPVNVSWSYATGGDSGNAAVVSSYFSTESPAPLAAATTFLPEAFNKTAYNYQLASSGGVCPCTWILTSGTLPSGLSLSTGGLISGTPTQTIANVPLTFKVTDSNSSTASTPGLTLAVASSALSITTTTCPTGTQYAAYAGCNIVVTGGTSPYKISYSASSTYAALPEGMTLNSSTGAIASSQIGGQGTYGVDFIVTDANGATTSRIINIGIAGSNAFLSTIFPSNSIFHHRVDAASTALPVDASPAAPISPVYQSSALRPFFGNAPGGLGHTPNGIPAFEIPCSQPSVPVTTTLYQSYFTSAPFPANAPVEDTANGLSGGDDNHVILYQAAGCNGQKPALREMWQGALQNGGAWTDSSNALWSDVTSNALTPQGTGTADAAGLPVGPLLLNADEVIGTGTPSSPNGTVQHPTRFTLNHIANYWVWPATDTAGVGSCIAASGAAIPGGTQISQSSTPSSCSATTGPAGEIYRLKASVTTPGCASTSPQANIIITALRNYGIILADNGETGGLIGTPDTRWNDSDLACLGQLTLSEFEPVNVSSLIVSNTSGQTSK